MAQAKTEQGVFAREALKYMSNDIRQDTDGPSFSEYLAQQGFVVDGKVNLPLAADTMITGLNELAKDGDLPTETAAILRDQILALEDPANPVSPDQFANFLMNHKAPDPAGSGDLVSLYQLLHMTADGQNTEFDLVYTRTELEMLAGILPGNLDWVVDAYVSRMDDPLAPNQAENQIGDDFETAFMIMSPAGNMRMIEAFYGGDTDSVPKEKFHHWRGPGNQDQKLAFFKGGYNGVRTTEDGRITIKDTPPAVDSYKTHPNGVEFEEQTFDSIITARLARTPDNPSGSVVFETPQARAMFNAYAQEVVMGTDIGPDHSAKIVNDMQTRGILEGPMSLTAETELKRFLEDQDNGLDVPNSNTDTAMHAIEHFVKEHNAQYPDDQIVLSNAYLSESVADRQRMMEPVMLDYLPAQSGREFSDRMQDFVDRTPGMRLVAPAGSAAPINAVPGGPGVGTPVAPAGSPAPPPPPPPASIATIPTDINLTARVDSGGEFVYSEPVELGAADFDIFKGEITTYDLQSNGVLDVVMSEQEIEAWLSELNDTTPTLEAVLGEDGVADAYFISNDAGEGFYIGVSDVEPSELSAVANVSNLSTPAADPAAPDPSATSPSVVAAPTLD